MWISANRPIVRERIAVLRSRCRAAQGTRPPGASWDTRKGVADGEETPRRGGAGWHGVAASGVAVGAAENCHAGWACIYDDNNYNSELAEKRAPSNRTNVGAGQNDKTDSWLNRSDYNGAWFYDINGGGNCYNMIRHTGNPNLGVNPSDELSSWRVNGKLCGG
jgi:hypothetical protein